MSSRACRQESRYKPRNRLNPQPCFSAGETDVFTKELQKGLIRLDRDFYIFTVNIHLNYSLHCLLPYRCSGFPCSGAFQSLGQTSFDQHFDHQTAIFHRASVVRNRAAQTDSDFSGRSEELVRRLSPYQKLLRSVCSQGNRATAPRAILASVITPSVYRG